MIRTRKIQNETGAHENRSARANRGSDCVAPQPAAVYGAWAVVGMIVGTALFSSPSRGAEEPPKRPALPYTVSKETTFLTEPLRPDGSVDYAEAINQRIGKGVTPENNAAVLIWRAAGPKEIPAGIRARYFARMGIEPPNEQGNYLSDLDSYLINRKPPISERQREKAWDQLDIAESRPWSRNEFPLIAEWLAANEKPLALIVEASKRPRRFDPLIGDSGDDSSLVAALLPSVAIYRTAARLLCVRAMLKAKANNLAGAWDDVMACYRLSRLIGQGFTLIDTLVAVAIDSMAFTATGALLENVQISGEQLERMRQDIAALTPQRRLAEIIDQGERLFFLDCVAVLAKQGLSKIDAISGLDFGRQSQPSMRAALMDLAGETVIDWDHLMRKGNRRYDRIVAALNKPSLAQRRVAMNQLRDELTDLRKSAVDPESLFADALLRPRQAVSDRVADILIALLVPVIDSIVLAEDRWVVQHEVLATGLAAAAYAHEHGRLPEGLDQLVPKYLAKVPEDTLSDPPGVSLRFKKPDGGCIIYSVGRNRRDDQGRSLADAAKAAKAAEAEGAEETAGTNQNREPDWDDIVIRLKAPTVER